MYSLKCRFFFIIKRGIAAGGNSLLLVGNLEGLVGKIPTSLLVKKCPVVGPPICCNYLCSASFSSHAIPVATINRSLFFIATKLLLIAGPPICSNSLCSASLSSYVFPWQLPVCMPLFTVIKLLLVAALPICSNSLCSVSLSSHIFPWQLRMHASFY